MVFCARSSFGGRIRQPDRVFPALPRDFAPAIAAVGSKQNSRVEKNRRQIIDDEFEGELVTREFEAIARLPEQKQDRADECRKREPDPEAEDQKSHPGKRGLEFAQNGCGRAAHEFVEILAPAAPHLAERTVHANGDESLARTEPQAPAVPFYAAG